DVRDGVQLRPLVRPQVVRGHDAEPVARLLEPRHRLPHLADRTALERELRRHDHGLVADRDRAHAEPLVAAQVLVRRADDRESPAVRVREACEVVEQRIELRLVADGIAADERRTRDDAIGEERPARRREVVALVASQREEGEAVASVRVHELADGAPLHDGLLDRMRERAQPEHERREAEQQADRLEDVGQPVADGQLDAGHDRGCGAADQAEHEQHRGGLGVARHVEARAPADERDEQEERDRCLFEVEPLREMRDRRADHEKDSEPPRPPPATRDRAGEPDQADPECKRDDPRRVRNAWRQHALDDVVAVGELGGERRGDPDAADDRRGGGEERLRPEAGTAHGGQVNADRYNVGMQETARVPLPRWIAPVLGLIAAALVPWTLYLTFTLPGRHTAHHYDVAWVGFDCALLCSFAVSAWCAGRAPGWLVPAAAVTGTMLLCDAWFDVISTIGTRDADGAI